MADSRIVFLEKSHRYILDGRPVPSVTQLLQKHGITPDFSSLPIKPQKLAYAAERGTLIHREVQDFIQKGEEGISPEFAAIRRKLDETSMWWMSETMLYCDQYAGTCDLIGLNHDTRTMYIMDIKTGHVDKHAVAWQLSMYERCIKGYDGYSRHLFVIDAKPDKTRVYLVNPIPEWEIQRLLDAEALGEKYSPSSIEIKKAEEAKLYRQTMQIAKLELKLKKLQADRDAFWENIKSQCRENGIKKLETAHFTATYVAPTIREGLDSKKLQADLPDVYAKYKKVSNMKDSIRVTVKEGA